MFIISFLLLCFSIALVLGALHMVFFDWYANKRKRETKEWQEQNKKKINATITQVGNECTSVGSVK